MKNKIINKALSKSILILLTVMLLNASYAHTQVQYDNFNAQELVTIWLNNDCDVADQNILSEHLRRVATEAAPLFINGYRSGPNEDNLTNAKQQAQQKFKVIQEALKSDQNFGLSEEDLKIASQQTAEDFSNQSEKKYILAYRTQALLGLGIVGGERARILLEQEIQKEEESIFKSAAQKAWNMLKNE